MLRHKLLEEVEIFVEYSSMLFTMDVLCTRCVYMCDTTTVVLLLLLLQNISTATTFSILYFLRSFSTFLLFFRFFSKWQKEGVNVCFDLSLNLGDAQLNND